MYFEFLTHKNIDSIMRLDENVSDIILNPS